MDEPVAELFRIGDIVKASEYGTFYYRSTGFGSGFENSDEARRNLRHGRVVDIFVGVPGENFLTIEVQSETGTSYHRASTLTRDMYIINELPELPYTPDQQEG